MDTLAPNAIEPRPVALVRITARSKLAQPLHRIAEVCRREGVSERTAARRLGVQASEITRQQEQSTDLRLSDLYRWQELLDVPLDELLAGPSDHLAPNLLTRARLVRLMKSGRSIAETATSESENRFAHRIIDLLLEIMPELDEITAWHSVGQRRDMNDLGRIMERRLPDDLFFNDFDD